MRVQDHREVMQLQGQSLWGVEREEAGDAMRPAAPRGVGAAGGRRGRGVRRTPPGRAACAEATGREAEADPAAGMSGCPCGAAQGEGPAGPPEEALGEPGAQQRLEVFKAGDRRVPPVREKW